MENVIGYHQKDDSDLSLITFRFLLFLGSFLRKNDEDIFHFLTVNVFLFSVALFYTIFI